MNNTNNNEQGMYKEFLESEYPPTEQAKKERFTPISLENLMNKKFPPTAWIVDQLVPAESITAISGLPSAYKTWAILEIALQVAKGGILFDNFLTTQTGVLIIDEETGERWLQERIAKMQKEFNLQVQLLSKTGFKLREDSAKWLISYSKENNIGLVIFDSLIRIHTSPNENDAVEMAKVFSLFQKLSKEGIASIFTQHNRKPGVLRSSNPSQDMRGSSDILAAVDCHISIERQENVMIFKQTKLRQAEEIKPFKLRIITNPTSFNFEYMGEVDEVQTKKHDIKQTIKDILSKDDKPMYKKELFENIKKLNIEGGYSTFKTAVQEMVDNHELYEEKGERNKVFCTLKPSALQYNPILDNMDSEYDS